MTKNSRRIIAVAAAITLAATANLSVAAQTTSSLTLDDVVTAFHQSDVQHDRLESMTIYNDYLTEKEKASPDKDHQMEIAEALPSKLDLRNVDGKCYVSPVKQQNPWATCWSFGACAAAETSLAYALGHDYNDKDAADAEKFDLSERHLGWFMYNPLPEDNKFFPSQAGEGNYPMQDTTGMDNQQKSDVIFNTGGFMSQASTLFSAGIGPMLEKDAPYEGKDAELYNKIYSFYSVKIDSNGNVDGASLSMLKMNVPLSDEGFRQAVAEYEESGCVYYSMADLQQLMATGNPELAGKTVVTSNSQVGNGDWTLDEKYRFHSEYELLENRKLASPARSDKNGAYVYDANATEMMKNELVNGRAIAIAFKADQAFPGQTLTGDTFFNFVDENGQPATDKEHAAIWAQYTYDKGYDPSDSESVNRRVLDVTHAVCVVGYDDNFPKEFFNDPKGTLQGNGAWLVKNSWGCVNAEKPSDVNYWGNSGDGYFWLSYYDQSIAVPETYRFAVDPEAAKVMQNVDMYDFMPQVNRDRVNFDGDVLMANIFTAQNNCTVRFIGIETVDADTTVEYSVYYLNDDAKLPTDGECLVKAEETFPYAGYHKIDLGRSMPMVKDSRYSIVAKATAKGASTVYFNHAETQEGFIHYYGSRAARFADSGNDPNRFRPDQLYSKGVINTGESFVGVASAKGTEWADLANITAELKSLNAAENIDYFTYDNFPIRSYPETEPFTATNILIDGKEQYAAGDEIRGKLAIVNNLSSDFDENTEIELLVKMGAKGEEHSIAKLVAMESGKTCTFDYAYIVTQADADAGKVVSTLKIKVNGVEVDYNPVFGDILSFTVKTAYSYVIGDADGNGRITIDDVTAIQQKLAEIPVEYFNRKAADIRGDGLTISDATDIQRYIAGYSDGLHIGRSVLCDKYELPFIPG